MQGKLVLLSGWKRSGKDTYADLLRKNKSFAKYSFAKALKDVAANVYPLVPRRFFDEDDKKEAPLLEYPVWALDNWTKSNVNMLRTHLRDDHGERPDVLWITDEGKVTCAKTGADLYHTPRSLAVLVGSAMRVGNPHIWVDMVMRDVLEDLKMGRSVVISDWRFRSERARIKDYVADDRIVEIRLTRFTSSVDTDASERDLDNYYFDHMVDNTREIEVVYQELLAILAR